MVATLIRNLVDIAIRHTPRSVSIDIRLYRKRDHASFEVGIPDPECPRTHAVSYGFALA